MKLLILGFPGVGKSYASNLYGCHDSDSSKFSWLVQNEKRNPEFPRNYVAHLKSLKGIVFGSTHQSVRDAMYADGQEFYLMYPDMGCRDIYLERFARRGSPQEFIQLLHDKWGDWITELNDDRRCVARIILKGNMHASDALDQLSINWHNHQQENIDIIFSWKRRIVNADRD